jgi:tetratricopeptide (TPR) repeat protein
LTRAQTLHRYGQYRKAVFDYNEYEKLIATGLTDQFYYIRFQSELKGHLFQQALNDISKAIEISPKNTLYYAEKASLEIRVNMLDEAIRSSEHCISIEPQNSDGYLFKGLALCLKGNKTEGIILLEKAKELGDNQAQVLISKYRE